MLPPIPAASATGVVEESDALAQLPQPQPQLALAAARPSPFVQTPLMLSAPLSAIAGCQVYLKLENLQPSGSFKSRGIGHYMHARLRERGDDAAVHFYCSSGGNAGLACATAALSLNRPATIIVPTTTLPSMIARIRARGGTVHQTGASLAEADAHLRAHLLARDPAGVYVPPFDHPDIWAGNATCVAEAVAQLAALDAAAGQPERAGRPDAVVCSVGGGGLLNGVVAALDAAPPFSPAAPPVAVLGVETRGAHSLAHAIAARRLVALPAITSIATSLGAPTVSSQTLRLALSPSSSTVASVRSAVISDAAAARASVRFADDERTLVEAACGASLALCYDPALLHSLVPELRAGGDGSEGKRVLVVVCGGSNVSLEVLEGYRRKYGMLDGTESHRGVEKIGRVQSLL